MPLYEYACEQCGERFEVMQKFADEPLSTHDKCGGTVHRLISAPAFQFKGSGWYVTDYAKGSGSSSGEKSSSDNGAPAKSDGPAATTPAKSDAPAASSSSSESKPTKPTSSDAK